MGWQELLLIVIVALLFLRPKDIPTILYQCGRMLGQARQMMNSFMSDVEYTHHNLSILEMEKEDHQKSDPDNKQSE